MKITKKIETKQVTETEVEIELPYYSKKEDYIFFKVLSEKNVISVFKEKEIYFQDYLGDRPFTETVPCTKEEFDKAYNDFLLFIYAKNNEDADDNL